MSGENETYLRQRSLSSLIDSAATDLATISEEAKNYLLSITEDKLLEQHRSEGCIQQWTASLLQKVLKKDV